MKVFFRSSQEMMEFGLRLAIQVSSADSSAIGK
jgi:hypothetical protein